MFTAAGVGMILFPILYLLVKPSTDHIDKLLFVPFGLIFLVPGALLLFRIDRMHIDLKEKVLYTSSKLLWYPEKVSTVPLDIFTEVYAQTDIVRDRQSINAYHRVYLESTKTLNDRSQGLMLGPYLVELADEGVDFAMLRSYNSKEEAINKGKELAEILSLPFQER